MRPLFTAFLAASLLAPAAPARAQGEILSVKTGRANVRGGPYSSAEVLWRAWIYTPFQVVERRGEWIRVMDFEEYEGWLHESTLSEAPGVIVSAEAANVRSGPGGRKLWIVDKGYPFLVSDRRGNWLQVDDGEAVRGWIHRSTVWGRTEPPGLRRADDGRT